MERREVRFHHAARAEYHDAIRWYRAHRPESGVEFQREIERAIEQIFQYPEAWPHADEICRRFIVNRFRHALVYAVLGNSIWIVAVAHTSRRPGYWQERLQDML